MSITKFNKGCLFNNVNLENTVTVNLSEITGIHKINAIMFSTKGEYGRSAFIVFDNGANMVWLPTHMVKVCDEILTDADTVADIKEGRAGFSVETYTDKKNNVRYTVRFEDI